MNQDIFFSRDLSWLSFNDRVLAQAQSSRIPVLEKLRFLIIAEKNLDEFFMVKVSRLTSLWSHGLSHSLSPDHISLDCLLESIGAIARRQMDQIHVLWQKEVLPDLNKEGLQILGPEAWTEEDKIFIENDLKSIGIAQNLTTLTPFFKHTKSYLFQIKNGKNFFFCLPETTKLLLLSQEKGEYRFALLSEILAYKLQWNPAMVRVTRNVNGTLDSRDFRQKPLKALYNLVSQRELQEAIRLEISENSPVNFTESLLKKLKLSKRSCFSLPNPLNVSFFESLCFLPLWKARVKIFHPRKRTQESMFSLLKKKDVLLHHPYESFSSVTDFLTEASRDPHVLSIHQTLYRTGQDPSLMKILAQAARKGKKVHVIFELKARFDETNNIRWAQMLKKAGAQLYYGFSHWKIHTKATLVTRKEGKHTRHYCHLSTGNYNPETAHSYTDLSLFSAHSGLNQDLAGLFQILTGRKILYNFSSLIVAPFGMRERLVELIQWAARGGSKGKIFLKINHLLDESLIRALYDASSNHSLPIYLFIRGMCALRPGIKGLSSTIEVRSLVDRFLEHSRIYYFSNGLEEKIFLGSADWMPRNMEKRIEIIYPVEEKDLQDRLINGILATYWQDQASAFSLNQDGKYNPPQNEKDGLRAQDVFMALAKNVTTVSLK